MNLRHLEIVIEQDRLKVDIQKVCMEYKTIKQWAYILHDKDDTRSHYHIYLNFGKTSCDTKLVAKWFELGYTNKDGQEVSGEQNIEKVKGRKADILLYLIHGQENQKHKHQYSPTEVVSNFDYSNELVTAKILGDFEHYSYAQQLEYVHSLPVDERGQAFTRLEKLWKVECQHLTLKTDRNIEVIFITGKGGTGKTYYAKKLLKSMGLDYAISSSSNDPFQDYLGQKAIILDDLRAKNKEKNKGFEFDDLLKILDNHTSSSVSSRFNNKVFNGKVIVITSSVPIKYWYSEYKSYGYDTLNQLYRRITCYIEVTLETISVFSDGVDVNGNPKGLGKIYKNEVSNFQKKKVEKIDFCAEFDKIADIWNFDDSALAEELSITQLKFISKDGKLKKI